MRWVIMIFWQEILVKKILTNCFFILTATIPALVLAETATAYTRFALNASSTRNHPSFFYCTVVLDSKHPTSRKFSNDTVRVMMVNYGQMILKFNDLGMLDTNASEINHYAFSAYHDSRRIYKNQNGFVDVFVLWPSYKITCHMGKGGRPLIPLYG
jgi:hypothetical protein